MAAVQEKVIVGIEEEIQKSYLDYAMSVIIGRALPDLRDGLKPVHRRILYAMFRAGNLWNRPYRKAARVVGDVIGQYHPHGDTAVYDSLVRMAQPFSMRYPFVDGQGNFGSIDGDAPAAMRYTEVRMARIAQALLDDLDKNTVDFLPNYDNSLQEPTVLPAGFPVLLVIGSQGIAVGMATNIPPHNLTETIDALIYQIENPDATVMELMRYLPGPDFPTGGFIYGRQGIIEAYSTGKGIIRMRAKAEIEDAGKGYERIVVTEIPYLVNKARMVEHVADLVKEKRITGIRDIRDESARQGMRVVFELKKDESSQLVLNQLFKFTALESSLGIQMLCVHNGRPDKMTLPDILKGFNNFRKEVVTRRTRFELARARERAHILEGLKIALDHLDEVIALIRAAENPATAREGLMNTFGMSREQAQAVLDMRLQRLTGLERDKILDELQEVLARIEELEGILASEKKIQDIIVAELIRVKEQFGDERRTIIIDTEPETQAMDLIRRENMVVTISTRGFVKRVPESQYKIQRPGGKGRIGARAREEDVVDQILYASSHDTLMCFTNRGRVHWLPVYQISEQSSHAKGTHINNYLRLDEGETAQKILTLEQTGTGSYIVMASKKGYVKKTTTAEFSKPRAGGLIAVSIDPDDELIGVNFSSGADDILLATAKGKVIRFSEDLVRPMGRQARGVTGIRMNPDDTVIGMELVGEGKDTLLTITRSGFGKRTALSEYPLKGRGGKGVITIKNTAKLGDVVAVQMVDNNDHMLILTSGGRIIRLIMSSISIIGRLTQGRTLVKMNPGEHVVDVTRAQASENDDPDALEDDGIETAIPDDADEPGLEEEELDEEEDTEDEEDVDDEDAK